MYMYKYKYISMCVWLNINEYIQWFDDSLDDNSEDFEFVLVVLNEWCLRTCVFGFIPCEANLNACKVAFGCFSTSCLVIPEDNNKISQGLGSLQSVYRL